MKPNENFAVLGCYAARIGTYGCFGPNYRSRLRGFTLFCRWGRSALHVSNLSALCNIPEERTQSFTQRRKSEITHKTERFLFKSPNQTELVHFRATRHLIFGARKRWSLSPRRSKFFFKFNTRLHTKIRNIDSKIQILPSKFNEYQGDRETQCD